MEVQDSNKIEMLDENSFLVFDEDEGYSTFEFDIIMGEEENETSTRDS